MYFFRINKYLFIRLSKARDLSKLVKKVIIDKNGNRKTVYVRISDELNKKRSLDFEKKKWFMDKNNNNIKELINFMRKQDIEYCCVTNDGENAFFKKVGNKKRVFLIPEELKKIQGSKIHIHNHPKGRIFSPDDIFFMLSNDIKNIYVVYKENGKNITHSLKIKKEIPVEKKPVIYVWYKNLSNIIFDDNEIIKSFLKHYGEYFEYKRT